MTYHIRSKQNSSEAEYLQKFYYDADGKFEIKGKTKHVSDSITFETLEEANFIFKLMGEYWRFFKIVQVSYYTIEGEGYLGKYYESTIIFDGKFDVEFTNDAARACKFKHAADATGVLEMLNRKLNGQFSLRLIAKVEEIEEEEE